MTFAKMQRTLAYLALPLVLITLPACQDSSKDRVSERRLDDEKARSQELEQENQAAARQIAENNAKIVSLSQGNADQLKAIKELEAANKALSQQIEANQREIALIKTELDSTSKSLGEKTAQVKNLLSDISNKDQKMATLETELNKKSARISETEAEISRNTHLINELKKSLETAGLVDSSEMIASLAAKTAENAQLSSELSSLKLEKAQVAEQLSSTNTELATLRTAHAALSQELEAKAYSGVMALLENRGPESLFAVTDWKLRDAYELGAEEDCLFIFNIDRNLEAVSAARMATIPSIRGLNLVPLRIAYQKVAVCSKDGQIRAQQESGHIYKAIPQDNVERRALITARTQGSCDKVSSELSSKSIFDAPFQNFYPYVGQIDGIETINLLRPNGVTLEFNMGSSTPSTLSSSCKDVLSNGLDTPLAKLACRLAQGEKAEDLQVELGCFSENPGAGKATLNFNK